MKCLFPPRGIVPATLLLASLGIYPALERLSAVPSPFMDCNCAASKDTVDNECTDVCVHEESVGILETGICDEPGCEDTRPCKFDVHLKIVFCGTITHDIQEFHNGFVVRTSIGARGAVLDDEFTVDCGADDLTVALGYDNGPCVEAIMECADCTE